MKIKKIIDISLPLSEGMVVYPNNPRISIETRKGQTSTLSKIDFGSHTGTHVDAPKHVFDNGKGVDKIELEKLIGECRVLDMTKVKESVKIADFKKANIKKEERILVKTKNSQRGFTKFYKDYVYLDGEAAEFLAKKGISLFGIDYLSVKKRGGADLRPHTSLLKKGIVIFEGLDLSKMKPGKYFFIGLPLRFVGLDGSPARAVLLK
ncbi:MAG: arylformamidase [Parcubacteria group bacterium Gr01-1014_30]|nr:MAG: arylformamidase [Parcubacteria group bacterium Gr01-1014_30]